MASPASLSTNDGDDSEQSIYSFSPQDAKESIRKTGAYVIEDAPAGRRVNDFITVRKLPLRKLDGLDFCAQNSLYDKGVRDVVESSIDRPHWGLAKVYKSEILPSDKAYFFIEGPEMRAVYILLFTPYTRFHLFEGSHNRKIPGKVMSKFGLLTLPHDRLEIEGITRVPHDMSQGGFALIDGRVGWTILGGQQIAIGYASEAEIAFWAEIELGDTYLLRQKVAELNEKGIRTHFVFVKPQSNGPIVHNTPVKNARG